MGDSQVVQPERDHLISEIADALRAGEEQAVTYVPDRFGSMRETDWRVYAEIALSVIERPSDPKSETIIPCTCGQNGYAPNSPHSNHPHLPNCLHYHEATYLLWFDMIQRRGRVPHNHLTRDIKTVGLCPGCDLYHAAKQREMK